MAEIVVAGGCFWGVAEYYRRLKGVNQVTVGYAQGWLKDPTYQAVCQGDSGHVEAVRVNYDPATLSLNNILEHLFRMIDPTSLNKQGNDVGTQYRTGVYYKTAEEKAVIENYFDQVKGHYHLPLVVEMLPLDNFYNAEDYHQDYLVKNPSGYCHVDFRKIKPEELK